MHGPPTSSEAAWVVVIAIIETGVVSRAAVWQVAFVLCDKIFRVKVSSFSQTMAGLHSEMIWLVAPTGKISIFRCASL
eukprot:SAG31_NODE_5_length_43735_cov_42.922266_18_plen_78_part_00